MGIQQVDPTRTITARAKAAADFKRRYTRIKRLVVESIVSNDAFGLLREEQTVFARIVLQEAVGQEQFADLTFSQQVEEFDGWLETELNAELLDVPRGQEVPDQPDKSSWFVLFLIGAFLRGMRRGRLELARMGKDVEPYPASALPRTMLAPVAFQDKVDYIINRTFANIKNVNETTRAKLRTVLAEALAEGVHPREIARRIAKTIDEISVQRGILIARTEIIAAHHLALIAEYRQAGVLGIRLMAEWLTAGDGRVCPKCAGLARKDNGYGPGIYTLDQIEFMIPAHPNCRCMAIPVDLTD